MKKVRTGKEMANLLDLAKVATEEEFLTIQKKLAFDSFRTLLLTTPVDTGLARSSWRVGVNTVVDSIETAPKKTKDVAYAPATYGSPRITFGDSVSLYNNLVYMIELENGSSSQAPFGMVETAAARANIQATALYGVLSRKKIG